MMLPTGSKEIGLRPRHAWMLKDKGYTNPYTADEVVVGAHAIMTLDFTKRDVPLRFNLEGGFMYANLGSNTVVYSTGLNWFMTDWIIPFIEFSGEFRVEGDKYPIDFFEDPMTLTPGIRLHTPFGVDIAGGFDLSVRSLRNFGRSKSTEMRGTEDYTITYKDEKGYVKTYGYVPTATYAFTGLLTWYFGGAEKAPERECPQGLPPQDTVAKTDTLFKVDTLVHVDTVVKVDTVEKTESFMKVLPMSDTDEDGVSDDLDKCPDSPKGITVDTTGCPRDFDVDGVPDYQDMCPNTLPNIGVDSTGCAKDEDRDGVADDNDKCPATGKGIPVDTTGCPMDTDKDGVADYQDKCPYTLEGVKIDAKGCPTNKKQDLNKLKQGIEFKTNSTKFTKNSYGTLNDIVALMQQIPNSKLEVQGHTDNVGSAKKNKELSENRALAVVNYLVMKGIEASRLRAVGYGGEKPIASNGTKKGRKQNRRVELVPFE
jgi:outer membrane protein OmpA-like peptidoglycan-associated protein